jgi:hypothetical protein
LHELIHWSGIRRLERSRSTSSNDDDLITTLGCRSSEDKTMSKVADSIRRGLREAVAYAKGKADENAYRIHVPEKINVKAVISEE